jgi:regulation of enolase protein 1 (concanavalin A-like superfamily)
MAAVSGRQGVALQSRANNDILASTMRLDSGTALPLWLKVERHDGRIRAGHSPDGQRWVEAINVVHDFAEDVEVGIAASSHRGVACRALFESVEVLGTR